MNTQFQKGITPWNKGKAYTQILGKKHWNYRGATICECGEKKYSQASKCWDCHLKNRVHSKTEFKKGHKQSGPHPRLGMTSWNKGMKMSDEHREKLKGPRLHVRGANNYNWKGGITEPNHKIRNSMEYKIACADSKQRDDYTCQMPGCGIRGGELHSNHIKLFSKFIELRTATTNLITLCKKCHMSIRGKEEQYEALFTEINELKISKTNQTEMAIGFPISGGH